jgi:hypothetical protein
VLPVVPDVPDELPLPIEPEPEVPDESVELPLPAAPDPVVPEEPVEPVEPVDGLVEEDPEDPGVVPVELSAVLLQPAKASAAASASAAVVPVFNVNAYISVFL